MEQTIVGVAGMGLLGRGIAACLLAHDITVIAYTPFPMEFALARAVITESIDELIERAGFDPSLRTSWQARFVEAHTLSAMAPCTLVIESIIENLEAKTKLFTELEAILPATVPIASNTSAIPISLLQQGRTHPERFLGMHWAIPAHCTRFLELIRGDRTNDASMQETSSLSLRIGKDPCVVNRDVPGFIVNRISYAMYREACHLLATGIADAGTIDRAFRNSVGLWANICGPLQWIDLTGGPALYGKAMTGVLPTLSNATEVPEPIATMMQNGDTGTLNGRGFYDYAPGDAERLWQAYREHVWSLREILEDTQPLKPKAE